VGRGGAITGRGADLLVIDDPIKDADEARSDLVRKGLHDWYSHVAYTRLQPMAAIVLIQTRWHEDDLAGWLLREHGAEQWEVVSFPAVAETDEVFRRAGEALWPEKFPLERLTRIRAAIGGAAWASLYQQRPSAAEGAIFRRDWWQRFRERPRFRCIVQSWDTAFKNGLENDFSVCSTWGAAQDGYYLLHVWRGKVEFPDLKRQVISLAAEWKPHTIIIEDKTSGQSLIQELRFGTALRLRPIKADRDKIARAQAITPLIEAGRVFLPESAPWLDCYIDEMAAFPSGVHDDAVDSTTQALNFLRHAR
jgi:predicted phage terminase large subunit-like protein